MAEERIDLFVIPEKIEWNGKVSENGDGDADSLDNGDATDSQFRRASISSTTFSENLAEKPLPHYLRASTGSCHDFCKFGRKHALEEKKRRPQRKNLKSLPNEPEFVQIFVSGEKKKEKIVRQKSSVDTIARSRVLKSSDMKSHMPTPKEKSSKVIKKQSQDLKLSTDEMKISPTPKVKETKSFKKRSPTVPDNSSPRLKPSSNPKSCLSRSMTSLSTGKHPLTRTSSSVNTTRLSTSKPLHVKKHPSSDHPEIIKRDVMLSSGKTKVGGETSSSLVKVSRAKKNTEKFSSPNANVYKANPLSTSGNASGLNRREVKVVRKKPLAQSAASLSSNISLSKTPAIKPRKDGNPLNDRSKTRRAESKTSDTEKVPEKTLHVIKIEDENSSLGLNELKTNDNVVPSLPSPSSHSLLSQGTSDLCQEEDDQEAEYSGEDSDDISCDDKEIVEIGDVEPVSENSKKYLRKSKVVSSEVKHHSPVKLKFRSGKVVELHTENNTPRRLRFRRARIVGIDQGKGDSSCKRTFKLGANNEISEELSSEKVSLKHQDVQGKKEEQGLFNNVIEETASKLAESRKSKVKALVGAFETVISLQESKPASSNAVN